MDLLQDRRFTVASHGIAAAYAGWLLRRHGASVDHRSALDPESIGAFLADGATFDPSPRASVRPGGVLITDAPVTAANRVAVRAMTENATVVWITPWGSDGPWSERPASDLVLHAAGGWMSAVGEPHREPLGPPGAQARFVAGLYAAIAALAPSARRGGAAPGLVEVPIVEAVTATMIYDSLAFQYHGRIRERVGNRFAYTQPTIATLACKDGYIGLHAALHAQWIQLCELIGLPELVSDPRFAAIANRSDNIAALDAYLLPWLAERTRWEAFHELQRDRIPSSAHPSVTEVLASPQLAARASWDSVATPSGRSYRVPGSPTRVLAQTAGAKDGSARTTGPWEPGRLRVVDLSMGWAGPLVSHILASFGADVIKVESHVRFDWWRGSRPPGDDAELALHERSHVFNTVNRGKRGITLNLTTTGGCALLEQLAASADVLVENFGAGVMERLGLGYDVLSADNPGLIMLRQPGFGSTGPEASYLAFGNTIEGMSGLTSMMGYEDGPPVMMSNALGDPVSGLNGTVAVLSALVARERDGRGRLLECAQLEGFLPLVSEALIEYQRTGEEPRRQGNARAGHVPSAGFECSDGRWVAVDVEDDVQWAALASAIGEPWAVDASLANATAREKRRQEVESRLGEWALGRQPHEVVTLCAAAGVPVSPVHDESEVLFAEPFGSSDFWSGEERAVVGFHQYPSLPIVISGQRPRGSRPAPLLGEHNHAVLLALGVSSERLDVLASEGVIGRQPAAAAQSS